MPRTVKKIKKLAPIMTSGETIKTLFNDNKLFRQVPRVSLIANAPSVPMIVAIKDDNTATNTVLITIVIIRESANKSA